MQRSYKKLWLFSLIYSLLVTFVAEGVVDKSSYCHLPALSLNERQLCDLELLFNGGFAPLHEFMDRATYEAVCDEMRLPDGTVWPMPITLDIDAEMKRKIEANPQITLRDGTGKLLAVMHVEQIWAPDKHAEAQKVYQTQSPEHPGVSYLFNQTGAYYISGKLTQIAAPSHYDFMALRRTPEELKAYFKAQGIEKVVGFQTRNPLHRAHFELTKRAAESIGGHLLLHPAVGVTKPGDLDYWTRVKCYEKLLAYYPENSATLSLLPIAMRMAGPREALWHAIIRKNYGCTHFIVGRDHAGPGKDSRGKDFYAPYAAQELVAAYESEIGIKLMPFKEMVYVVEDENYQPIDQVDPAKTTLALSGTELRRLLREGGEIPEWFSFPEVMAVLKKSFPPRVQQGVTLFFTGLSGAGKSTLANIVAVKLMEMQERHVALLDGDLVRQHLSKELGFSKEHRSMNVRRVGFVASEICKQHGIVLCALIAPYREDRAYNRALISEGGNYIEVYVKADISECERRDPKGMYAKYRKGVVKGVTGLDDPYEEPLNAEIVIDTMALSVEEAAEQIVNYLVAQGFL